MRKLIPQAFILTVLVTLFGCGGGGSATDQTSDGSSPTDNSSSSGTAGTTDPDNSVQVDTTPESTTDTTTDTTAGETVPGTTPAVTDEGSTEPALVLIDLLIVYNRGADEIYDGSAETRINHLLEVSNQIYVDSEVNLELRAVYMGGISYEGNYDSSTALDHITFQSHPAFSDIDTLRTQYGADIVVLMRPYADDGSCGLAWIGGYGTQGNFSHPDEKDYAYAHVAIDCGSYVLAHELGHTMGLNHSRLEDGTGGTFDYALGHGANGEFVTVMASPSAFNASKVKLFSSPHLSCNGSPCGISRDNGNGADAAYTLNHVSGQVAAYYDTTIAAGGDSAKFDADGDGISDLLLRHVNGMWNLHLLGKSLTTKTSALDLQEDVSWQPVSRNDFNGDGFADLLVRNQNSGDWHLYLLVGATITEDSALPMTSNTAWQPVSSEDFDGDGRSDILLRNRDGRWHLYTIEGTSITDSVRVRMNEDADAELSVSGDFNGDRSADVLLSRPDGSWYLYLLSGAEILKEGALPLKSSLDWQVTAAGDFNGNGRDEILLRDQKGQWFIDSLDGLALARDDAIDLTSELSWRLATTGDFNGDGNTDVLLRNENQGSWFLYTLSDQGIVNSGPIDLTDDLDWTLAHGN